ncbi:Hsp20/alpha crystallin family protein [Bacillus massiliglaciei]|uniref:Hsp20/alpha crystallin family protein n=1 Tax=Bacillus massiliglaciei TaxID=1816693 RepID=UPI0018FE2FC3|nr:Hsp20/alpha crystallin family protein [Bacillus massiliglaciei]
MEQLFSQVMPDSVQSMMNQGNQETRQQQNPQTSLQAEVLETLSYVFIRIPMEDESLLKQAKIYHTSNQTIIEGIPESGDQHTITLPSLVRKKGAYAQYKSGILEIRLLKNADQSFSEVDVPEF